MAGRETAQASRVASDSQPEVETTRQRLPNSSEDDNAPDIWGEAMQNNATEEKQKRGQEDAPRDGNEQDMEPVTDYRETEKGDAAKIVTHLYTLCYLIFFSLLGTLARVGLTALTSYRAAPVFSTVWANFGGSLIMGYLLEDRMLFRHEWGTPTYDRLIQQSRKRKDDVEGGIPGSGIDLAAAKKAHQATKKTIPLYVGMATGFCGSFTSFSTFIRDVFLALSNNMAIPGSTEMSHSRNGGYSFMAMLSVIITDVSLSIGAFFVGIHLATSLERVTPSFPVALTRKFLDRAAVILGLGCWLGAVLLSIFPPHDYWRGRVVFSLVFAPVGTLIRFYLALYLNSKVSSFPLGTFIANILGTAILGMAWDIAHVPAGGIIGCQVMQGLEDGLCGCLTTVSTWVAELSSLRKRHAYIYGTVSVVVGLVMLICIMGGVRWTDGFHPLLCAT